VIGGGDEEAGGLDCGGGEKEGEALKDCRGSCVAGSWGSGSGSGPVEASSSQKGTRMALVRALG
jgi:hypothetical protein